MVGAVAGTPGTNPTNWANSTAGLTKTIVGIGTANGINYIDVRFNGTTSSTSLAITTDATNIIAASNGQAWTSSAWLSVVGGSTVNLNEVLLQLGQYTSAVAFLSNLNGANIVSSLTSTLTRFASTLTTNDASVAFIQPVIVLRFASGVAIDITLRIGLPQLELGAFATSVIPTTTTALTRAADVASVNTLSPWYNSASGTLYAEYSIPFALTASSGPRLGTFVGAGGAGVDELSLFVLQTVNRTASANVFTGGVNAGRIDASASFVANTIIKAAQAYASNDRAVTTGGSAPATSTAAYTIPTVTTLRLGSQDGGGTNNINGYLRRVSFFPRRLSNAELQALTT
jgi:hypothetical protein